MRKAIGLALVALLGTALAQVRSDGSSTVYPITQAVAEEFVTRNPQVKISVAFSGTGAGFQKFCRGETDVQNASRPIRKSEMEACQKAGIQYIEIPIAYDALSILVNKQNTWAQCLTTAQLKSIWEPNAKVNFWKDLNPAWPNRRIVLFGAGTDSGTFDYFTEAIMGRAGSIRKDYFPSEDDNVIMRGVTGNPYAMAFVGFAYYEENKDKVRALAVDGGKGCVAPSRESVLNGTYTPLARPLFIYVNLKSLERKEVRDFVDFYLSPAARRAIRATGYVELPEEAYRIGQVLVARKKTGSFFSDLPPGTPLSKFIEELRKEVQ
ncbi:MAG: PstS family phosphate ABC transporter substrate-binding protein [Thermus sp.]|uniref:PstS family phosphate ABC transporter substrate-binding protein n=1 Tax=Thermus sp. TaxID=275 RepID=UPI0025F78E52|nr:PstS family phosphate ABC transporter substrate-binding protein [Thermus sp.]MCS7217400.1 PstS family phosphate ABC transporter substrate-binding protein [Thermus sp.]MCX7848745.1 PstS family phosphate ABC transporter substrate-binding protein [Thermus sp.]MDW8017727.1 PstS family phosphate ABC transporter substrate-binding protein [Thermus sp.]MDW8357471.1 PstS family phosphate ABC transporter substrate-binding protein [Thermus sp.]